MKGNPKSVMYIYLTIVSVSGLGWYINAYSPITPVHYGIFFLILFCCFFFLCMFFFHSFLRATLYSSGVILIFLLRLFELRSVIYPVLLICCLFFTDRIFRKMKK